MKTGMDWQDEDRSKVCPQYLQSLELLDSAGCRPPVAPLSEWRTTSLATNVPNVACVCSRSGNCANETEGGKTDHFGRPCELFTRTLSACHCNRPLPEYQLPTVTACALPFILLRSFVVHQASSVYSSRTSKYSCHGILTCCFKCFFCTF